MAASRAQCIACWAISLLGGCAYPIPLHLCRKAVPSDPKILSLVWDEENWVIVVERVIGDEKYDWETLNVVMIESMMLVGRVCCDYLSGFVLWVLYLCLWYSHIISISKVCIGGTIS